MLLKPAITHQAARLSEKLVASGRRDALRDPMRSVKFGGFGMRALRADRARISTSPRSRSVAGNAFRLIASSETRAGRGEGARVRITPQLVRVVHGARDLQSLF